MKILSIDAGTIESGYCLSEGYKPLRFGKISNEDLLQIVKKEEYDVLVYEAFQSYGMPVGQTTIDSITWNGRYIQSALDREKRVEHIFRREEKLCLCGTMKAKDTNIRQALIDRFAQFDFKNGKGTKKRKDYFYGFSKDSWTAMAITVCFLDKEKGLFK